MKRFFLIIVFFILIIFNSNASNQKELIKSIPWNFQPHCYKYYKKINLNWVSNNTNNLLKIKSNKSNIVFTQSWYILPSNIIESKKWHHNYSLNILNNILKKNNIIDLNDKWINNQVLSWTWELNNTWSINEELEKKKKVISYVNNIYNNLKDDDEKTSFNFLLKSENNSLIIELENKLKVQEFNFNFKYFSEYYFTSYSISDNWIDYKKINRNDINNYSFKYLKIDLISSEKKPIEETLIIYELSFNKNISNYIIKYLNNYNDIESYSNYSCNEGWSIDNNYNLLNNINYENLKGINIELLKNPKYTQEWSPNWYIIYSEKDIDNDWVSDSLDNCKTIYNPKQIDTNKNWIWDSCQDDDNDNILWYLDNCPNNKNPDQADNNNNKVWDVCETDIDKDWIIDYIDNCININNPDQLDSDKDNIWDKCDNCNFYNPWQIDKNSNNIWDICENIKNELLKIDSDLDWILNYNDNCELTKNPDQLDSDKDNVWDKCDNCLNIKNRKQIDLNKNNIWDMCEDSDWDSIIWYKDNCINIWNINQDDNDNNWVWDFCEDKDYDNIPFINDNCPYDFNPNQEDIDNDLTWDICDNLNAKYIKSNKWILLWVFMIIWIFLWYQIWIIYKKFRK